ncbi:MAG: hypothetical protein ACTFAL_16560 [Candidatus Electronema sp. V4]|uniref:hypothetical protein n=1 Tax=Candidatus Electronema sp. V4 TaxID=3454756 RepID=UPI0040554932
MLLPTLSPSVARGNSYHHVGLSVVPNACVSVAVQNGKACLDLPIVGKQCIDVPSWVPNFSIIEACADICTTWGFPTGACVSAKLGGMSLGRACFGWGC